MRVLDIEPLDTGTYVVKISLGNWSLQKEVSDSDLQILSEEISRARGLSDIMAKFSCTESEANKIRNQWGYGNVRGNIDCKDCQLKGVECYKCLFVCQSPLEQSMFREFRKRGIEVILQRIIRKDGSFYDAPKEVEK